MLKILVPIVILTGICVLIAFSAHVDPLTGKIGRRSVRELLDTLRCGQTWLVHQMPVTFDRKRSLIDALATGS